MALRDPLDLWRYDTCIPTLLHCASCHDKRRVFQNIVTRRLTGAGRSIIEVSSTLLGLEYFKGSNVS